MHLSLARASALAVVLWTPGQNRAPWNAGAFPAVAKLSDQGAPKGTMSELLIPDRRQGSSCVCLTEGLSPTRCLAITVGGAVSRLHLCSSSFSWWDSFLISLFAFTFLQRRICGKDSDTVKGERQMRQYLHAAPELTDSDLRHTGAVRGPRLHRPPGIWTVRSTLLSWTQGGNHQNNLTFT